MNPAATVLQRGGERGTGAEPAAAADPHATDLLTRADAVAASQSPTPWVPERQGGAHGVRRPVGCERVLIGTPERKGTP